MGQFAFECILLFRSLSKLKSVQLEVVLKTILLLSGSDKLLCYSLNNLRPISKKELKPDGKALNLQKVLAAINELKLQMI